MTTKRLTLFPKTSTATNNHLQIGGCTIAELAETYGTPLYLYDKVTLDESANQYRTALQRYYPAPSQVTYAGKAFLCIAIAQWVQRSNLWLDCTGAGELHIATRANVPRSQILVHGVNKSEADLVAAIDHAGTVVIDNLDELDRFHKLLKARQSQIESDDNSHSQPSLWFRVRPGIAVDTHAYTQTGQEDSKFGMSLAEVIQSVRFAQEHGLSAPGLHFHQGSHFHNPEPIGPALETILDLILEIRASTGWLPQILCPGGGWGVPYHEDDLPHPTIDDYVRYVAAELIAGCKKRELSLPVLHLEPGRSIIAQAGVAVYRVGSIKQTQNKRWLMIDGGLADNPRPALYQARYTALPVAYPNRSNVGPATFGGPFCESGDILIHDLEMPDVQAGDYVAVPMSGAYQLSMSSNYNGAVKPAVLWLDGGYAHLIQRRQDVSELVQFDLPLPD